MSNDFFSFLKLNKTTATTKGKGSPFPFGVHKSQNKYNFSLIAKHAKQVFLEVYSHSPTSLITKIQLDPFINKTEDIWHIELSNLPESFAYGYRITQSEHYPVKLSPNNESHLLVDPYAKSILSSNSWGSLETYQPLGLYQPSTFDWEEDTSPNIPMNDLIIYEMHVRSFTQDPSSKAQNKGGFLGIIEKIPYLKSLGINAVELLPIMEFNESEYNKIDRYNGKLYNYWGYSPFNFFSTMNRYASNNSVGIVEDEFKTMVKALHKENIEVILDVVFNHTSETNSSPYSLRGIDYLSYYLTDSNNNDMNFSGCGNTLNANHPHVINIIIESLKYWVLERRVDGFRFDLASTMSRDQNGNPSIFSPILEAISQDPILSKCKLIAEPWDAVGLYEVGNFCSHHPCWFEWNDQYRDTVKNFIKGTDDQVKALAQRISGSQDIYDHGRSPYHSINYITAHDGFSLRDLVSYNTKHNHANGEENRDGSDSNKSWNCGAEGKTEDPQILELRERQMRNFYLALMVSQGTPLICMGDEYGHTKNGNNNTWCLDHQANWFQWDKLKENNYFYKYCQFLNHFRKGNPLIGRKSFLTDKDVFWHGQTPFKPNWGTSCRFLAFTLKDHIKYEDLYVAFNSHYTNQTVTLPEAPINKKWHLLINTAQLNQNFFNNNDPLIKKNTITMIPYSAVLLKANH